MTLQFYKSHTSKWFEGKRAVALREIRNNGGDKIKKGQIVILEGKRKVMTGWLSCSGGFGIRSVRRNKCGKLVSIRGVEPQALELK